MCCQSSKWWEYYQLQLCTPNWKFTLTIHVVIYNPSIGIPSWSTGQYLIKASNANIAWRNISSFIPWGHLKKKPPASVKLQNKTSMCNVQELHKDYQCQGWFYLLIRIQQRSWNTVFTVHSIHELQRKWRHKYIAMTGWLPLVLLNPFTCMLP